MVIMRAAVSSVATSANGNEMPWLSMIGVPKVWRFVASLLATS